MCKSIVVKYELLDTSQVNSSAQVEIQTREGDICAVCAQQPLSHRSTAVHARKRPATILLFLFLLLLYSRPSLSDSVVLPSSRTTRCCAQGPHRVLSVSIKPRLTITGPAAGTIATVRSCAILCMPAAGTDPLDAGLRRDFRCGCAEARICSRGARSESASRIKKQRDRRQRALIVMIEAWKAQLAIARTLGLLLLFGSLILAVTGSDDMVVGKQQLYLQNVDASRLEFFNTSLLYARCQEPAAPGRWRQNRCRFDLERYGFDGRHERLVCNVSLPSLDDDDDETAAGNNEEGRSSPLRRNTRFRLYPYAGNLTLVRWTSFDPVSGSRVVRHVSLDFTDCSLRSAGSLDAGRRAWTTTLVFQPPTNYEIFVWERRVNRTYSFFKLTYDARGRFVDGPEEGTSEIADDDLRRVKVVPLLPSSSGHGSSAEKKYLVIEQRRSSLAGDDESVAVVSLMRNDGKKREVNVYPLKYDAARLEYLNPVYSASPGKMTLCSLGGAKQRRRVNCTQYDQNGRARSELVHETEHEPRDLAVLNSPNGDGFYLLTVDCSQAGCSGLGAELRYRLLRFNDRGGKLGSSEYQRHGCSRDSDQARTRLFVGDGQDGEQRRVCVSVLCGETYLDYQQSQQQDSDGVNVVYSLQAKCHGDEDLGIFHSRRNKEQPQPQLESGKNLATTPGRSNFNSSSLHNATSTTSEKIVTVT
ncbi:unnamed protein product [Trichogramma brassicae]|uniref:Uncharacterized protein n=1 Tax=Trichogramma brassicae TaxID=86971 RepID=A0A6H5IN66_9HYME|nr:unnamed protein product [Trichogramma brassicae]